MLDKVVDKAFELAGEFVGMVKEFAESGHEIEKIAQITGLATDEYQRLAKAASMAGVEQGTLNHGLMILSRTMAAAKDGGEEQAKAFHKVGVKYKESNGHLRSAGDVLKDLADHFKTMPDGAEKVALSMKLLGRSGAELIPLLNLGGEKIEQYGLTATVMTEEQIAASKDLVLAQKQLGAITTGIWKSAIYPLIPAIRDLVKQYLAWRKENAEIMKQRIKAVLEVLISTVKVLAVVLKSLTDNWKTFAVILVAGFVLIEGAAVRAAFASAAAWLVAAAPVVALVAALALLYVALDDIINFMEGNDSLIGRWIDTAFGKGASAETVQELKDAWDAVVSAVKSAAEEVKDFIGTLRDLGATFDALPKWGDVREALGMSREPSRQQSSRSLARQGTAKERQAKFEASQAGVADSAYFGPATAEHAPENAKQSGTHIVQRHENNFYVRQMPGEDGEHFAQRVAEIARQDRLAANEEAGAAIPATQ